MSMQDRDLDANEIREQDRWLPIANVDRVMRNSLPKTAKISKEAKECMQECVSEFISFITSQAAEKCLIEKRKTLNGEDILYSLYSLGFENYAEVLRIYLAKYRIYELDEVERRRRKYLARKEKMKQQAALKKKAKENEALQQQSNSNTNQSEGLGAVTTTTQTGNTINNNNLPNNEQFLNSDMFWELQRSESLSSDSSAGGTAMLDTLLQDSKSDEFDDVWKPPQ